VLGYTGRTTVKIAISIGNFDAVHLGHIALVKAARQAVGADGQVDVWSFDPSPVSVLKPEQKIDRLTTFPDRTSLLLEAGADEVKQIVPTKELLSKSPKTFISEVVEQSPFDYIVEGEGFRFGKNRAGNCQTLEELGHEFGFQSVIVEGVEVALKDQSIVRASSSMIRWLLHAGRVEDAAIMLGRDVTVSGVVAAGDRQGRALGYPTANVHAIDTMLPRDGIYAGCVSIDPGESHPAAISIGTKPTFGEHERVCEVHIIGYDGAVDHYDWPLTVTISHWIRDQLRFDSKEELIHAIEQDVAHITKLIESSS
jgi:riboflavin kinase/FMN adenylyltransferase